MATDTIFVIHARRETGQAISNWLKQRGYNVHVLSTAEQLSNELTIFTPDLILMDIKPNGRETCASLKSQVGTRFLPVILLSDDSSDRLSGIEAGADDVLISPFTEGQIAIKITAMLRILHNFDALKQQNNTLESQLAKRAKEMDRAQEQVRQYNLLRDSIVRNVSHELRTPLLQAKAAVNLLAEDLKNGPNSTNKLLDFVVQSTARLEGVVQNITQLAASMNMRREVFQVSDTVQLALRQLGRLLQKPGVDRIEVNLPPLPPVVGDHNAIAQVLHQLLDNGLKFSKPPNLVKLTAEHAGQVVWISVRDHGIGIPTDQLDKIFQAFYQVDSSNTRPYGGTGVGLTIAKMILEASNAPLEVKSKPGEGSLFRFALPIAQDQDLSPELHSNQPEPVRHP